MPREHPQRADRKRWEALRLTVFERDGGVCVECGQGPPRARLECDHRRPVRQGGAWWDAANLQTLCRACHKLKSNAEGSNHGLRRSPQRALWKAFAEELG